MQILNTYAGATIALMDNAEQATWETDNPAVGDFLINTESRKVVYMDDSGVVQEISLEGDQEQVLYDTVVSGSTYVNSSLIGATPYMLFQDGFPLTYTTGTPSPGVEWSFDDTTGTIDIGTDFDNNKIIFTYRGGPPVV